MLCSYRKCAEMSIKINATVVVKHLNYSFKYFITNKVLSQTTHLYFIPN